MNAKSTPDHVADYVIVGAGSAGCVLAARLSQCGKYKVILLEYGGSDAGPLIQMPAALSYPMNMARYDWGYKSEPELNLNDRRMVAPRGKVIGGSSSINGMVYVRGHARDFDHWGQLGATGWSFANVQPYFQRLENVRKSDGSWRGQNGPMHVTRATMKNPLYHAFIDAGKQAGFEATNDYNGEKQEGFCTFDQTIWRGRRWSAANAYLKPALKRANLSLVRGRCSKILFRNKQASGVAYEVNGKQHSIEARREVILSASAFNSPQLLMLSGIGPAAHLQQSGVDVLVDRAGVGENLQDHLELYVQQECTEPISLYTQMNLFSKARIGLQWLLSKTGEGASNHFEAGAFLRSAAGVEYPDIQFHFLPIAVRYDGNSAVRGHGFQAHVGPMRSLSRGNIRLKSNAATAPPKILFNYMSHEKDWAEFRYCIRLAREIFAQPAFDALRGNEISPGSECTSDNALDDHIREHAESAFHPCGTCKMGDKNDSTAVVDPQCRVIGVEGLRVVDSSIFPSIPYGNINAPTLMVAEKAADHILGNSMLPTSTLKPWINPRWKAADR